MGVLSMSKLPRSLSVGVTLAAMAACSHGAAQVAAAPSGAAVPCRVSKFDLDAPGAACVVPHRPLESPPPNALAIRTVPSPAHVRSGRKSEIALELRNVSGSPLPLDVDDSCMAFTGEAESSTARSLESECGGLCYSPPTLIHVILEPGGVVTKQVAFEAVMRSIKGDACTERVLGPLPPGRYTLHVFLPWSDPSPIPGNPEARASRVFDGRLVVDGE